MIYGVEIAALINTVKLIQYQQRHSEIKDLVKFYVVPGKIINIISLLFFNGTLT